MYRVFFELFDIIIFLRGTVVKANVSRKKTFEKIDTSYGIILTNEWNSVQTKYHWGRKHYIHQKDRWEFIWCNAMQCIAPSNLPGIYFMWRFWWCNFGILMVPLGLTHIYDAGIGDVNFVCASTKIWITTAQIDAIHCIIKIGLNSFDVTRYNGSHHKNQKTILKKNNFRPSGIVIMLHSMFWFANAVLVNLENFFKCIPHIDLATNVLH